MRTVGQTPRLRPVDRRRAVRRRRRSLPRAGATAACGRRRPARRPSRSSSSVTAIMPASSFPARRSPKQASRHGLSCTRRCRDALCRLRLARDRLGRRRLLPRGADRGVVERRARGPRAVSSRQSVRAARRRRQGRSARRVHPSPIIVRIELGEAGFERMADKLDATFARGRDWPPPRSSAPASTVRACSFAPMGRFTSSMSAIIGSPACSMPPASRPRPCSRPCRPACCSISNGAPALRAAAP